MKVKVIHGFVKLLFYALPTGNLLHYTSGRNDVLHVSPIAWIPYWTGTSFLYSFPEKFPFPVHFRQSVIMVIARLFTGQSQAHYCVLCYGWPSWMSFSGRGTVWKKAGKITGKKFFSPPFPGCVKISTPVPSVHIWNQDGHTYRAGKRSILTILHKGDCEKCR